MVASDSIPTKMGFLKWVVNSEFHLPRHGISLVLTHSHLGMNVFWGALWWTSKFLSTHHFSAGAEAIRTLHHLAVGQNQWDPILGSISVGGLGPVHWGLTDLGFDPWPFLPSPSGDQRRASAKRNSSSNSERSLSWIQRPPSSARIWLWLK